MHSEDERTKELFALYGRVISALPPMEAVETRPSSVTRLQSMWISGCGRYRLELVLLLGVDVSSIHLTLKEHPGGPHTSSIHRTVAGAVNDNVVPDFHTWAPGEVHAVLEGNLGHEDKMVAFAEWFAERMRPSLVSKLEPALARTASG